MMAPLPSAAVSGRPERSVLTLSLCAVAAALIVQWWLIARGLYAISGDEPARILMAECFAASGHVPIVNWLPLPTLVTGTLLRLWPDMFWAPRVVNGIAAALAVGFFVWWASMLTRDPRERILAAVLVTLFPARAILGAVPMAESLFFLLTAGGCAFALSSTLEDSRPRLLMAAGLLALASLVRYEAWLLVAVFVWLTLRSSRPRATKVLAVVLAPLGIVIWLGTVLATDRALLSATLSETTRQFRGFFGDDAGLAIAKYNFMTQFLWQNAAAGTLPCLVVVYRLRRQPEIRAACALAGGALVLLTALSLTGSAIPTHNPWRIPTLWSLLLLPFTSKGLVWALSSRDRLHRLGGAVWAVAITALFAVGLWRAPERTRFSHDDLSLSRFLHDHATHTGERILIESRDWSFLHVQTATMAWSRFDAMDGWPGASQPTHMPLDTSMDRYPWIALKTPALAQQALADRRVELAGSFGPWRAFKRIALPNALPPRPRSPNFPACPPLGEGDRALQADGQGL
jgi:hypothetical protein